MNKLTCTILIGLAALPCSYAADAPAANKTAPQAEAPAVELKHKSTFTMEESGRNPFWPIGWKPVTKISTNPGEHSGPQILSTSFLVSSIVIDSGAKFAIVNGKTMAEGQVFGLQMGTQTYQITVKSIEDGRVVLMRRDEEIVVPLHRR